MEGVTVVGPDNEELALPEQAITIKDVDFTAGQIFEASTPVKEYLERLAYDLLEQEHSGWEDGDGAYGEFRFTVDGQTITLEYNERYIETNYFEHQF